MKEPNPMVANLPSVGCLTSRSSRFRDVFRIHPPPVFAQRPWGSRPGPHPSAARALTRPSWMLLCFLFFRGNQKEPTHLGGVPLFCDLGGASFFKLVLLFGCVEKETKRKAACFGGSREHPPLAQKTIMTVSCCGCGILIKSVRDNPIILTSQVDWPKKVCTFYLPLKWSFQKK